MVITAGFGETGEAGRAAELRILEKVRDAGIRMVGPNCMGVINTDARREHARDVLAGLPAARATSRCRRRAAPSGSRSSTTRAR